MKLHSSILIVAALCLNIAVAAQEQAPRKYQMPGKWNKVEAGRYAMDFPDGWTKDVSGDAGTTFFVHTPLSGGEDNFTDNINLLEQPVAPEYSTLDAYVEMSLGNIPAFFTNSTIIAKEKKKLAKRDAYMIEYKGELNGFELHFIQYIMIIDNKAVILTFTAQPSDFDYFKEAAVKAMNSLKINP
ncbi:MAG: hypothetical protein K1X54_00295 [Flavobacteriales bacterium]|nr:hypothetical protein [Flavobacteriales bacterium]